MPLAAKSKPNEIWNGVIERCERRLSRWKAQYLSRGGRLVLINSVLDALFDVSFPSICSDGRKNGCFEKEFFCGMMKKRAKATTWSKDNTTFKETRWTRHQEFEDAEQKPNDEVVLEIF